MRIMTSTAVPEKTHEETSTSVTMRVTSHISPCPEDYLRCIDGLCISLDQICDKVRKKGAFINNTTLKIAFLTHSPLLFCVE